MSLKLSRSTNARIAGSSAAHERSSASVNAPRLSSWVSESVAASCASRCSRSRTSCSMKSRSAKVPLTTHNTAARSPSPTAAMTCDCRRSACAARYRPGSRPRRRTRRRRTSRARCASRCRGSARASAPRRSAYAMASTDPQPLAYRIVVVDTDADRRPGVCWRTRDVGSSPEPGAGRTMSTTIEAPMTTQ